MTGKKRGGRYPTELRERAVRMVFDHQNEYSSQWAAIESISEQLGVHSETLRSWVRRAETDSGAAARCHLERAGGDQAAQARERRAPSDE
jgi:transposase-like protein